MMPCVWSLWALLTFHLLDSTISLGRPRIYGWVLVFIGPDSTILRLLLLAVG